jgi:hypothetical protein
MVCVITAQCIHTSKRPGSASVSTVSYLCCDESPCDYSHWLGPLTQIVLEGKVNCFLSPWRELAVQPAPAGVGCYYSYNAAVLLAVTKWQCVSHLKGVEGLWSLPSDITS